MVPVPHRFPLVITSNSGYPLDQSVYQSAKGLSAAARIATEGGTVLMASACADGVPDHGNFGRLMRESPSLAALDGRLRSLDTPLLDQWQAQLFARILKQCRVRLYSELDEATVRSCKLDYARDFGEAVREEVAAAGHGVPVAVLPEGPLCIPYVTGQDTG